MKKPRKSQASQPARARLTTPSTHKAPIVVCYGGGRDSTALLVGMWLRGIVPDLIIFADTGSERAETYAYIRDVMQPWLASVGFPPVTVVRYECGDFKHWPEYHTLEENCLTNRTMPSIAYGRHSCSSKWKIAPQNAFLKTWAPALAAWQAGVKVIKCVGFDADEQKRAKRCSTYAIQDDELDLFEITFPLQEWKWTLEICLLNINLAGLPEPIKSSCYFCTAMKPWEVAALPVDKLKRIVVIEARALARNLDYARDKGWPRGQGVPMTEGLWRKAVKGCRGAIAKPGSMTQFILERGLLPSAEVARIIAATPTGELSRHQISNWQDWLNDILNPPVNLQSN